MIKITAPPATIDEVRKEFEAFYDLFQDKFIPPTDQICLDYLERKRNEGGCCRQCESARKYDDIRHVRCTTEEGYGIDRYCCIYCLDDILKYFHIHYEHTCDFCGKVFHNGKMVSLCKEHFSKYNRIRKLVKEQNRRAQKNNLRSDLTLMEWLDILERHDYKCAYCKTKPYRDIEHIIPVSLGGGTTKDNVVPSCKSCNSKKHTSIATTENLCRNE